MTCRKCSHQNEGSAKFCSACGEKLHEHVVQKGVPIWMWLVLIVSCITIGGVGYGFWDYYQETQSAPAYKEVSSDAHPVKQTAVVEKEARQEQYTEELDRVTLIKEVQQKVFTVITSYGQGSGFLYKKGGYVITNAHVVDGEVDVTVRNTKGQEFAATVIGISEHYDIALLHVPDYQNEEPLGVETSESPIGLEVIAFGSPQGFENSASIGYITGHNRDMELDRFIYKQIYQIDAQIDQGSSGGPLVDAKTGKVIGINSLLYTSETSTNFGFSIPLYSMLEQFERWSKQPMSRDNVLAVAGVYEQYSAYEEPVNADIDAVLAGQFVQSFRMYYELALNESNFYWVADMLAIGSSAYEELEDYVGDISYEGHSFYFITNDVLDVTYENGNYLVYMNETFDFYSGTGDYQYYDRYKTYTVMTDEYGAFKIADIQIH
ncbi:trypsin-like peptidase domain-containing protein [Lysinibacillus sp. KU-BSD001]|uniref:trypsin-like peptidase domain-containing protein n=1 Tax=Lysinibacillus sp. KU-BSD001 TaxID=3141328 RepID=UPI0036E9FE8C